MKPELVEALRKEGMFAPTPKGVKAQKPVERRDKDSGETTAPKTAPLGQKDTDMQNTSASTSPAVGGTKGGTKAATKAATKAPAKQIVVMVNGNQEDQPVFSGHRCATLAVDTLVVTATAVAIGGAGYGIYRLVTK